MPRLSPQAAAACVPAEVVEDHDVYPAPRMIRMAIDGALVVVAVAAILVWLVLALLHLGDRYKVGHVQGHWMALAQYANHGVLYPPLSDGQNFGGTRHLPLAILVNAAAARLTNDYLRSGKLVAVVLFALLLGLLMLILRQARCPWPVSLGIAGLLPATKTGMLVGSAPGGDVLPLILQLGALVLLGDRIRCGQGGWMVAAGVLAGLACVSKLTAFWVALAAFTWFGARRQWIPLAKFAVPWICTAVAAVVLANWASEGRMLSTLRIVTFAGTRGPMEWLRAPSQIGFFGLADAASIWLVAPFAIAGALTAWCSSTATVHHHALGWSLLIACVVFTDVGAGLNQLLDPAVLTLVTVGLVGRRLHHDRRHLLTLGTTMTIAIVWAGLTGLRGFVPDLKEVVAAARTGMVPAKYDPLPLAGIVRADESLLAEDPTVPVLLGRTPVVLDAFMLRRISEVNPRTAEGLANRIRRGEFHHVALMVPLQDEEDWWRTYHFGPLIVGALRESYVFAGQVDGYYLYRPVGRR